MTPDSLREQLQGFHLREAREQRSTWGEARLAPSPAVDAEFSDLFRDQTLAEVEDAFGRNQGRLRRWQGFIRAGCRRRVFRDERRELAASLQQVRPAAGGREQEAAMEQALALAAACELPEAGERSPEDDLVSRHLLQERSVLEASRRGDEEDSGETRQALVAGREDDIWRTLTEAAGFLRRGDGGIQRGQGPESGCLPEDIPQLIHLIQEPGSGLQAWEGQLRAIGSALALAHMPPRLAVEDRWLPGEGGAGIYGCLWARRLLNAAWLESMGVIGSRQDAVLRHGRDRLATRLLALAEASMAGCPGPLPAGWRWLESWPGEGVVAMAQLSGLPTARAMLYDEHMAALLDHLLLRRWGHRWEGRRQAADLLRQLWNEGWAHPLTELLSLLGESDPHGDVLLESF